MQQFFEKIGRRVYNAVKTDIEGILEKTGKENIYAVALVTDEDCVSIYLAVNTYDFLRKKDLKNLDFMGQYLSEEKIKGVEDGTYSLTKWIPAEWGYSDDKNSDLVEVSKLLFEQEQQNPREYAENKPLFLGTITFALKRIVEDNVLAGNEKITYFITLSDGDGIEEIENYSAQQLNSESVYEKFLKRFDDM